jgi:hypothetical protein
MMRFVKYLVLLALLSGLSVFGVIQYLHSKNRGHATEEAADAIASAANAAVDFTRDKTPRRVDVIAFFGEGPVGGRVSYFAVRARLTAIGGPRMSEVCASMPLVRDALNTVLFDRVHRSLDAHRALDATTLVGYEPRLQDEINRAFGAPVVAEVKLTLANPASLADSGCKAEHSASRH